MVAAFAMKSRPRLALPPVVQRYVEAANRHDAAAAAACFAPAAVVDEQFGLHRGRAAIRAWIEQIDRQFAPGLLVLAPKPSLADLTLVISVSGRFPGSPVQLDFHFALCGDRIGRLVIE